MRSVVALIHANPRKIQALICVAAFLVGFVTAFGAYAADAVPETVAVNVHGGRLIRLAGPANNVFVADPSIADVQVPAPNSLYVTGKKAGRTTVYALGQGGVQMLAANVVVNHDLAGIQGLLKAELPDEKLSVRSVPGGLVISGDVRTSEEASHAVSVLGGFIGKEDKIINQLTVRSPTQVNLRVRIAEMSRQVEKQLGFNWDAAFSDGTTRLGILSGQPGPATNPDLFTGSFLKGNWDISAIIDALAKEGLVTTLAEPNLTAVSGETASFLAGGEFPIPVGVTPSSGVTQIQIQFKQFGVSLAFTPTVLSPERISLKVRPEVSQIAEDFSITLNSIKIPGLQVRRAETTVELGSGQSFAIAGLMDNRTTNSLAKLPGVGTLPIIGPLFQSSAFQRNESELIIIVTPYVVQPMRIAQKEVPTPVDGFQAPSDLERYAGQRIARPGKAPGRNPPISDNGTRLQGDAGFYY